MNKKLSEMTNEELWQLFPIMLAEHNPCWGKWYEDESEFLLDLLSGYGLERISHIGSTAVSTIWAKPIVDILAEISFDADWGKIESLLTDGGYLTMSKEDTKTSLNKGYTEKGFSEKVFHLHLRQRGDNDELYFRDYLINNLKIAKEYEQLKLKLWKKFEHNRNAYTESKTEFIKKYTKKAKELYKGRYD
ncbi:MAG TPA: GrpB family protein [Clostridia bacterium]|nr:GrpB family protein [Clostridia bacterium]